MITVSNSRIDDVMQDISAKGGVYPYLYLPASLLRDEGVSPGAEDTFLPDGNLNVTGTTSSNGGTGFFNCFDDINTDDAVVKD